MRRHDENKNKVHLELSNLQILCCNYNYNRITFKEMEGSRVRRSELSVDGLKEGFATKELIDIQLAEELRIKTKALKWLSVVTPFCRQNNK